MSEKKKLDDEIKQKLEERLDDSEEMFETEEDFTVKVHREDYTVKRRFYDKGKALETADSLRKDKENIVEDNFEQDFEAPVADEDDVDWDKLMDDDIGFFPPISDAAEKKLETTSEVAEELAVESALVDSELDKTMTMGSGKVPNYPKIEPKDKPAPKKKAESSEIDENELIIDENVKIEIDVPGEIDLDASEEVLEIEEEADEELVIDEEDAFETSAETAEKNKYGKKSSPVKKLMLLLVVVVSGGLYYYFTLPAQPPEKATVVSVKKVVQQKPVAQNKVVVEKKPVIPPAPEKEASAAEKETSVVEEEATVAEVEETITEPEPVEPTQPEELVTLPEVTKNYPYTIHISSYKSQEKAESEVARIRKKGYDAFSALIEIPGKGGWRRIYTGHFETYSEATEGVKEFKKENRENAIVAKTFFGIQIGSIAEKENLSDMEAELREKGYTPYYIPVSDDGKYVRLMTGAYKFEKDISGLLNKLIEDGFDAEAVKR